MESCIFCKIIKGEIPSYKVYEDDYTLAFLDIRPVNAGHTLVISKDHFENIYTLPDETLARLSLTVRKIATAARNSLNADGVNIIMNNEAPAGQVIFHAHFHIIPRFENDGLKHWPQGDLRATEAETILEKIRENLED